MTATFTTTRKARCRTCCDEPRGAYWDWTSKTEDKEDGLLVTRGWTCRNCGRFEVKSGSFTPDEE